MIISFPIDNFSQVKDIFSDIFEIDVEAIDYYLNVNIEGVNFRFFQNTNNAKFHQVPVTIQITNCDLEWSQILRRLELYCYRYQTNLAALKFEIHQAAKLLSWHLGSGVKFDCYLPTELENNFSEPNNH